MNKKAFTLVEISVTIVIISIMVIFAVSQFTDKAESTKIKEGIQAVRAIADAQLIYKFENGAYATDIADLDIEFSDLKHFINPTALNDGIFIAQVSREGAWYDLSMTATGEIDCVWTGGSQNMGGGMHNACEAEGTYTDGDDSTGK